MGCLLQTLGEILLILLAVVILYLILSANVPGWDAGYGACLAVLA